MRAALSDEAARTLANATKTVPMMGIITPRWLVRLQVLFGPQAMLLRSIYAVYPSRRHLAAKVRVFVESIAKLGMTPGIS